MYIKEIKLRNFKTFKRESIPLSDEFIVISGPNGSGKSNIIDAIIFCLGLSSSRAIRAFKATDVIHKHKGRDADEAEVSIVFDNSDKKFPADGQEVVITRRVKRTSPEKYYSTYYMNGHVCTREEIHDNLAKARITPEGHNVILQREITQIADMNPSERRELIDELAGVSEFDERKSKAMDELETVKRKISETDIILGFLEEELKELEKDREQAIEYEKLQKEKNLWEGYKLLYHKRSVEREIKKNRTNAEMLHEELRTAEKGIKEKEELVASLVSEIGEIEEKIKKRGGEDSLLLRKRIDETIEEIGKMKSMVENARNEKQRIESRKKERLIKIDELAGEIRKLKEKVGDEKIAKQTLQAELDNLSEELKKIGEAPREEKEVEILKEKIERVTAERNEIQLEIDRAIDASRRRERDTEELSREESIVAGRLEEVEGKIEERISRIGEMGREIENLRNDIKSLEEEKKRIEAEYRILESELQNLRKEHAKREALLKGFHEAKYTSGVSFTIDASKRGELPGIYGTIASLGTTDEEYMLALEVCAGQRMEWIVADCVEDVKYARDYLRRKNAGRVTFLPLSNLSSKPLPIKKGEGIIDLAVNLIKFDKKFFPAFAYVYGDTIVVENFEAAQKYINRYRMVTLDGELFEKGGAITIGTYRQKYRFASLEGMRELEEKIAENESVLKKYDEEFVKLDNSLRSLSSILLKKEEELSIIKMEVSELEGMRDEISLQVKAKRSFLEKSAREREDLSRRVAELEEKRGEKESLIRDLRGEIERIESSIHQEHQNNVRRRRELEDERYRYEESIKEVERTIMELEIRIDSLEKNREKLLEELGGLENEEEKAKDGIVSGEEKLRRLEEMVTSLGEKEEGIREEVSSLQEERERKIDELRGLRSRKGELEKRCHDISDELSQLDYLYGELSEKLREMEEMILKNGISPAEKIPPWKEILSKIESIDSKIRNFGPVNMKALQRYEEVKKRRDESREKRNTLERERAEIIERIKKCEQMKHDAFMDAFNQINSNFKEIFSELSDGYGELVLENPENPFDGGMVIKAQPAGKTLLNIEARSGGEQSLIALSLLFSLQRYRPAPFYALDEVDTHLDPLNVEKVARMIKECSRDTQFIVVTLREQMIKAADRIIGIAMQETDVSTVTGILPSEFENA